MPHYFQAEAAFVPNVNFDFLLYSSESGPINISAKTSLRERYQQAYLEAVALKYVHRKSKSYIVTSDVSEAMRVKSKIKQGDFKGTDDVVIATENEFDKFIDELKSFQYSQSPNVNVIRSRFYVTELG